MPSDPTPRPLRIAMMGTPEFAARALDAITAAGHDVVAAYSQPPRPAGRGKRLRPGALHARADALAIPVRAPLNFRDPAEVAAFRALDLDAAVVAAYGLILPPALLDAPRFGCLNIHASLLPRWRGAAPIQRAILAGDAESGVSIMRMDAGLDTGPVLATRRIAIAPEMNAGALHDALAALGAAAMTAVLAALAAGEPVPETPQPAEGACYAPRISPTEARLDWTQPAAALARVTRAFAPRPGAWFEADFGRGPERLRVLAAEAVDALDAPDAPDALEAGADGADGADGARAAPGTTLDDRLTIACGRGALRLLEVQRAGKAAMAAAAMLRGTPVPAGTRLGGAAERAAPSAPSAPS